MTVTLEIEPPPPNDWPPRNRALDIEAFIDDLGWEHPLITWATEILWRIKKEYDTIILLCGPEGSGKSTFAQIMAALLDQLYSLREATVFYDAFEFLEKFRSDRPGQVIVLDEAISQLFNRRGAFAISIILVEELIEGRAWLKIVFLCVPNYKSVSEYIWARRCKFRCWVPEARGEISVKRAVWNEENTFWQDAFAFQYPDLPNTAQMRIRSRYKGLKRDAKQDYDIKRIDKALETKRRTQTSEVWKEFGERLYGRQVAQGTQ